ncbi:MAG: alpha/beta hydrolase [Dehalococcoidales bacterium]|nr:alpha/beta hydrolase [Dehalococcoidales bacterium]
MPVCTVGDININYRVYGEGFPLVLSHPFSASLEFWANLIQSLPPEYQVIAYDVRGHGLSSAPAGEENYTLDILVEDLHQLLEHLGVTQAYVGGLSLGGAISLGYAGRHPEMVKALLIFDIHGGFQPPADPAMQAAMVEGRAKGEKYARERGMADFARRQLATGSAFPPVPDDETLREQYVERMARFPVNGYISAGRASPWEAEWQRQAADGINVPTLITVGSDDLPMVVTGTRTLHEHIKGSRYVVIKGSVHETARWRPDLFNQAVIEFLEAVEAGKPVAGEITVG